MALPQLIIFDCDGVLVDSEIISNKILAQHLTEHGFAISAEDCRQRFIGCFMPKLVAEVRAEGVQLPDDFIDTLRQKDIAAFARELQPVSGVLKALQALPQAKCVASSGPPDKIRTNLEITGLIDFFDPHLFSGTMVANPKPAPDLFLLAARRMRVPAASCLVIEDSPVGIEAAKAAGMTCFGFAGASHCDGPYRAQLEALRPAQVFTHMGELPNLIAKLDTTG